MPNRKINYVILSYRILPMRLDLAVTSLAQASDSVWQLFSFFWIDWFTVMFTVSPGKNHFDYFRFLK